MKEGAGIYRLKTMLRKYRLARGTEVLLWSTAIAVIAFFTVRIFAGSETVAAIVACSLGGIAAAAVCRHLRLFGMNEKLLAFYLNRNYPTLRESAELLLKKDDELTILQQLQKRNTAIRFEEIYPTIRLPHHIGRAAMMLVLSVIGSAAMTSFIKTSTKPARSKNPVTISGPVEKKFLPASIKSSTITVSPPSYTKIDKHTSAEFDLQIPQGSSVNWNIIFEGAVSSPAIIFSGRDTITLEANKNEYSLERTFIENGFYQVTWKNHSSSIHYSDYYKLEIIKDNSPSIQIENPGQHVELTLNDKPKINLTATITDDYGLHKASIIATVSKGSGEAVKFREEELKFDIPNRISGSKIHASRILDLVQLGLQPGDELYFYVEASDNKVPIANRARSETYFVTMQDTSSLTNSVEASLGVDLMPEYFRSQRQIIIDSEKLLREKNTVTKQTFNERSNELAYDQKVLRLRYGEFLGEEFESGIGPQPLSNNEAGNKDVLKKFGHEHDTENEHNLVEEKAVVENHRHDDTGPDKRQDPLKDFVHAHDSDEEATFFVQSIKAKLKAAVTIMWDAELYLRLYQPEKSLPYQYKALKLLKEISQDSRIYVHRTGFDPPPLKEEKRLTGDLSEIINSTSKLQLPDDGKSYPHIRAAITAIEPLLHADTIVIPEKTKAILAKAGQELATLELKQPGSYLKTLSWLKLLIQNEAGQPERKILLLNIRSSMWKVMPRESATPHTPSGAMHELDEEFLKNLEKVQMNN